MEFVFLNGEIIDNALASIAINDRGFMLADGCFETILMKNGRAIYLDDHLKRMADTLQAMDIGFDLNITDVQETISTLHQKNNITSILSSIRITVTRGQGVRGLLPPSRKSCTPTILITLAPYIGVSPFQSDASFVKAELCQSYKRNPHTPFSKMKTLDYTNEIYAKQEADRAGATEAIISNIHDYICCASIGNLIGVNAIGELVTPPLADGCLDGITRSKLLSIGMIKEQSIPSSQFHEYHWMMCNSLQGCVGLLLDGQDWVQHHKQIICKLNQRLVEDMTKEK